MHHSKRAFQRRSTRCRPDAAGRTPRRRRRDALALDRLTLHGCAVEMETLREVDGWEAYETRRVKRAEKALDAKVLLGENAFDEGADVERRKRH